MIRFALLVLIFMGGAAAAVSAQSSGIASPAAGDVLSGQVTVRGTAAHPDFLRYELAFLNQSAGAAEWVVFADGVNQVTDGVLAVWDTTAGRESGAPIFPDGRYQLRLRVVKTDYNYDEYFVTDLTIRNDGPTPTPTPDETAAAGTAVATPAPGGAGGDTLIPATPIPSLTPFPTPTPPAAPAPPPGGRPPDNPAADNGGGLAAQLEQADTGRILRGFWLGVQISFGLFALLALYLILRGIFRWLWRAIWVRKIRK